jgi:transposase
MKHFSAFVGLDVHKDSIVAAMADYSGAVEPLGSVPYSAKAVVKALGKMEVPLDEVVCCYEAGPTGFGLQRDLQRRGVQCHVVAPSLVPTTQGDRVKTDRRDAKKLARYLRSGDLVAVHVPDEETEAIRDLERARDDAMKAQRVSRQTLGAFLLRRGRRYSGKTRWTRTHLDWIRKQKFTEVAAQLTLEDYLYTLEQAISRVERLTQQIGEVVEQWHLAPLVKALQAFRAIRLITAVVLAAELGDLRRFRSAPKLMCYVGLVPSEHSTGDKTHRGGITKMGNGHVRRVLVEAAWAYRFRPAVSRCLRERQQGLSKEVLDISWKAQQRLCPRYRRLLARGKNKQQTVTAIARELAGFVWAVGQQENLITN